MAKIWISGVVIGRLLKRNEKKVDKPALHNKILRVRCLGAVGAQLNLPNHRDDSRADEYIQLV